MRYLVFDCIVSRWILSGDNCVLNSSSLSYSLFPTLILVRARCSGKMRRVMSRLPVESVMSVTRFSFVGISLFFRDSIENKFLYSFRVRRECICPSVRIYGYYFAFICCCCCFHFSADFLPTFCMSNSLLRIRVGRCISLSVSRYVSEFRF